VATGGSFTKSGRQKVLAQLDAAPLQIKLGSPSSLNNHTMIPVKHSIFLNQYTGQTNLTQRYAEKKCLKILVYKQGVPEKKKVP
jgi:hypothetical protein